MAPFNPIDHLLLVVIVLLWPLYIAAFRYPRLRRDLIMGRPGARLRAYMEGAALEWGLMIFVLMLWFAWKRSAGMLGLTASMGWQLALGVVALVAVTILLTRQRHKIMADEELQQQLRQSLTNVSPMLPATATELKAFYGLSVTAGVCEEILYRGYVLWYISEVTNVVVGVLLSSLLFGLAHAYQGTRGMVQTGAVGLVLAITYVLSGTLWIPIAMHAFLDINSGRLAFGINPPEGVPIPDDESDKTSTSPAGTAPGETGGNRTGPTPEGDTRPADEDSDPGHRS